MHWLIDVSGNPSKTELGILGESAACREMERQGYEILARRYRTRYGEIDVIARHGATLVFIEVKLRASDACGGAFEAVTPIKRARLIRMATDYLSRQRRLADAPCRFDIVGVSGDGRGGLRVEVLRDAFGMDG